MDSYRVTELQYPSLHFQLHVEETKPVCLVCLEVVIILLFHIRSDNQIILSEQLIDKRVNHLIADIVSQTFSGTIAEGLEVVSKLRGETRLR